MVELLLREGTQGNPSCSSFEAQDVAKSLSRNGCLDANRARGVFRYIVLKGLEHNGVPMAMWQIRSPHTFHRRGHHINRTRAKAKREDQVQAAETVYWQFAIQKEVTLQLYRTHKQIISQLLYENSEGGALLFEVRAGTHEQKNLQSKRVNDTQSARLAHL